MLMFCKYPPTTGVRKKSTDPFMEMMWNSLELRSSSWCTFMPRHFLSYDGEFPTTLVLTLAEGGLRTQVIQGDENGTVLATNTHNDASAHAQNVT